MAVHAGLAAPGEVVVFLLTIKPQEVRFYAVERNGNAFPLVVPVDAAWCWFTDCGMRGGRGLGSGASFLDALISCFHIQYSRLASKQPKTKPQ